MYRPCPLLWASISRLAAGSPLFPMLPSCAVTPSKSFWSGHTPSHRHDRKHLALGRTGLGRSRLRRQDDLQLPIAARQDGPRPMAVPTNSAMILLVGTQRATTLRLGVVHVTGSVQGWPQACGHLAIQALAPDISHTDALVTGYLLHAAPGYGSRTPA